LLPVTFTTQKAHELATRSNTNDGDNSVLHPLQVFSVHPGMIGTNLGTSRGDGILQTLERAGSVGFWYGALSSLAANAP
jgi:hypothetical protein